MLVYDVLPLDLRVIESDIEMKPILVKGSDVC